MRCCWIRDKEYQMHFKNYWRKGTDADDPNQTDCFTKHHSTIHHKGIRHRYTNGKILSVIQTFKSCFNTVFTRLRGCIDPHSFIGYQLTQETMTSSFNLVTDLSHEAYVYIYIHTQTSLTAKQYIYSLTAIELLWHWCHCCHCYVL